MPAAHGAGHVGHILFHYFFAFFAGGVFVASLQKTQKAGPFVAVLIGPFAGLGIILNEQGLGKTVQKAVHLCFCKGVDGSVKVCAGFFGKGGQKRLHPVAVEPREIGNGATVDGELFVGDEQAWIQFFVKAQSVAFGTGSVGRVKGKHARRYFHKGIAAFGAGKVFAEHGFPGPYHVDAYQPVSLFQGCFHGFKDSLFYSRSQNYAVDDYIAGASKEMIEKPGGYQIDPCIGTLCA